MPEWLQNVKENLVDTNVQPHQHSPSSSHDLHEQQWYRAGKHSIYTHFPKDRNDDICLRTKIPKASCRRRAGTVVPRPETIGDITIADHKIVSEGCKSRNSHRYAVLLQDLATQW